MGTLIQFPDDDEESLHLFLRGEEEPQEDGEGESPDNSLWRHRVPEVVPDILYPFPRSNDPTDPFPERDWPAPTFFDDLADIRSPPYVGPGPEMADPRQIGFGSSNPPIFDELIATIDEMIPYRLGREAMARIHQQVWMRGVLAEEAWGVFNTDAAQRGETPGPDGESAFQPSRNYWGITVHFPRGDLTREQKEVFKKLHDDVLVALLLDQYTADEARALFKPGSAIDLAIPLLWGGTLTIPRAVYFTGNTDAAFNAWGLPWDIDVRFRAGYLDGRQLSDLLERGPGFLAGLIDYDLFETDFDPFARGDFPLTVPLVAGGELTVLFDPGDQEAAVRSPGFVEGEVDDVEDEEIS